ncbi:MAG: TraR/DksA family transcriptional regulator [Verrucomicrobiae bacterium]|nr:TraR/DksA family transcriptional regulator [Verrucomicrobiae bacterium]NNJ86974.1 RNA polymerase-binding protein DksA [Akkermansiaceae bacterium]
MTESEKKELRETLISQRNEVLDDVSRHGTAGGGMGVIADETERADVIAENMVEHRLGFSESKLLEKIEYALERLEKGDYGICDDCKKPINIERLKAKPSVSLCINCQSAKEQKNGAR